MLQIVATFTDDSELSQLRGLASVMNCYQLGRISNRRFYKKVKFASIENQSGGNNTKPSETALERNRKKYSGE